MCNHKKKETDKYSFHHFSSSFRKMEDTLLLAFLALLFACIYLISLFSSTFLLRRPSQYTNTNTNTHTLAVNLRPLVELICADLLP